MDETELQVKLNATEESLSTLQAEVDTLKGSRASAEAALGAARRELEILKGERELAKAEGRELGIREGEEERSRVEKELRAVQAVLGETEQVL